MNQQKLTRPFGNSRLYLSLSIGIWISIIIGICVFRELPRNGNSNKEIKEIELEILVLCLQKDLGEEIKWDQFYHFGYVVDATNLHIAIATIMMELSSRPKEFELSPIWENRVELSQKEWKMYKLSDLYIKSTLAGAGSLILTIPGVWFVLGWMILILGWVIFIIRFLWRWIMMIIRSIWDFFLDRISELSNAIRGKKETRSS